MEPTAPSRPIIDGHEVAAFVDEYFTQQGGASGPSVADIASRFGLDSAPDAAGCIKRGLKTGRFTNPGRGLANFGYLPSPESITDNGLRAKAEQLVRLQAIDLADLHKLRLLVRLKWAEDSGFQFQAESQLARQLGYSSTGEINLRCSALKAAGFIEFVKAENPEHKKVRLAPTAHEWLALHAADRDLLPLLECRRTARRAAGKGQYSGSQLELSRETELALLKADLLGEFRSIFAMTSRAASCCPSILEARERIAAECPLIFRFDDADSDFSLFDYLDAVEEIETSAAELAALDVATPTPAKVDGRIAGLLRAGLWELCNVRLDEWSNRPLLPTSYEDRGWRPYDPYSFVKLGYTCLYPALRVVSPSLRQFADSFGVKHSEGHVPDELLTRLEPAELAAHLVTKAMILRRQALRGLGCSISVDIAAGLAKLVRSEMEWVRALCSPQAYSGYFLPHLWRDRAAFRYDLVAGEDSSAIRVSMVERGLA